MDFGLDNAKHCATHAKMIIHPGVKLRHIRAFLDIASGGGLSAVARAQGISQPALSRTLAELEDLLGHALFLRQGRRLVLTEAGAVFRRHALMGLQALDAGAAALRPGGDGGRLLIGVLPTTATRFFPRVALRFHRISPAPMLSVVTGPHSYLMGLLRSGELDLMVGRMPAPSEMAGLRFDHLYEEDVLLCARAGHPLLHLPLAELLAQVPLVLPPEGALIRRAVEDFLASQGLANLRPAFETVALALGRGLLMESDALWFISRGVIADDLDRGDLVEVPTGAQFLIGSVGLTRRQTGPSPAGLDLLCQLARDAAAG
jgi:LysR family pca operon transcriptional activator